MRAVIDVATIDTLSEPQLRELTARLITEVRHKQATIEKLTHEMAVLKRLKFAARSEAFTGEQKSLLEEAVDEDLEALSREIERERPPVATPPKQQPKRQPLPANLPRREIRHEPASTVCGCGCQLRRIGEDVAEKLDYTPGIFTVERHVRGKWVCAKCETLIQAPVPAHVIDKGLPTTGLLAQVLVAKYSDHLPLYRQEAIFERAGLALSRSTLAQWVGACGVALQPLVVALKAEMLTRPVLHADETPVAMLKPGLGKTHRGMRTRSSGRTLTAVGAARWSATTTPATNSSSANGSPRPAAWRTRGGSSSTCGPTTRARWPSRRWASSGSSTTLSAK